MTRFSLEKRLPRYYLVYEEVHKNPFVPIYQITKRTGIARSTVSRYLNEMYERSILKGPMLFLNPAENYHEYAAFVKFGNSLTVYKDFKGFPYVISTIYIKAVQPLDFEGVDILEKMEWESYNLIFPWSWDKTGRFLQEVLQDIEESPPSPENLRTRKYRNCKKHALLLHSG